MVMIKAERRRLMEKDIDRGISVCFTGHRQIGESLTEDVASRLDVMIKRCYDKGMRRFLSGGALGFDTLAAKRVIEAKKTYPDIILTLVLPCRDQTKLWTKLPDLCEYVHIKEAADEVVYVQTFYDAKCMMKRNRYMVDHSSFCIAYFDGRAGGTANTVKYAKESGVAVANIFAKQPRG